MLFAAQCSLTKFRGLESEVSVFCPRTISEKPKKATEGSLKNAQFDWLFCMWSAVCDPSKYSHNPKVPGSNPGPAISNHKSAGRKAAFLLCLWVGTLPFCVLKDRSVFANT